MPSISAINTLDIIVAVILALCVFTGYKKGLVKSLFDLFSVIIALVLANHLFPIVTKVLRQSGGLYDFLKAAVVNQLGLSNIMQEQTVKAQTTLISELPVPDFLSKLLLSNNNDELYRIFNVSVVEDYIASYFANIILNTIALVLVFIVTLVIMKILSHSLDIVAKLPVISSFNRLGGGLCGVVSGTLLIWFLFVLVTFFFMKQPFSQLLSTVGDSKIAVFFYEHNFIMDIILKIKL